MELVGQRTSNGGVTEWWLVKARENSVVCLLKYCPNIYLENTYFIIGGGGGQV
jgi:hypothetical protein